MAGEIGEILFREILQISEYPGSPFTGNIATDIVQFLFIPTVFIIFFIYILLGRMHMENHKMRLLFGVAIYAFVVTGGYFRAFALITGPYFIVLIFILGGFYFLTSHFRVGGGHGGGGHTAVTEKEYENARKHLPANVQKLMGIPELNPVQRKELQVEIGHLNRRIERLERELSSMKSSGAMQKDMSNVTLKIDELSKQRAELQFELSGAR